MKTFPVRPGMTKRLEIELGHADEAVVQDPLLVSGVHTAGVAGAAAELGGGEVVLQGYGELAQVPGHGRSGAESLLDVGIGGGVNPQVTVFHVAGAQVLGCTQLLHVAQHSHHLELLAVLEAHEGSPVLHGSVGKGSAGLVQGSDTISGKEVHVLTCLGQDALGAKLEQTVGVLYKHERREGGEQSLSLNNGIGRVDPIGLDGAIGTHVNHVQTHLTGELGSLVGKAYISLGQTILVVVLALAGGTGGQIVVQVQEAGGKGKLIVQLHIGRQLGAAVEGVEGSTRLQVVHVRHVGGHGMPRLADSERNGAIVPIELHESLTQTQGGNRAAEVVEIGLYLTGDAHGAPLVSRDIQSQAGGEGDEAPVKAVVGVKAEISAVSVLVIMALGHVEIQVLGATVHGAAVGREVVTDEAVKLEVRGFLFLRKGGAAGEQGGQDNNDTFLHSMQRDPRSGPGVTKLCKREQLG